jgi:formate hydrogenlyase subunit 3/multisubunit Na+/H+ antiporter MnhD subunit
VSALLIVASFAVPFAMFCASAFAGPRRRMIGLLWLAPLPGLVAAILARNAAPLVFDADGLRLTLSLDAPGALLLGAAALLWSAAGAYAHAYLGAKPGAARFAAWWLLTLAGSLGVFVAGDLLTFYLAFAVVSLAAFGLVGHDATSEARRAAALYVLLAVLGEIALLLTFALLATMAPGDSLAIADVIAALPGMKGGGLAISLLLIGFGLKAGLVPLHVWLPIAHPAAPMPASAVLSGAIIKAGIIGLIRFLPGEGLAPWGEILVGLGFLTAFWGVAVGVLQQNPKAVLAYSSVSQMGVVTAVIGAGLAAGMAETALHAAFYALHHVLAKGALFLALGVATLALRGRLLWLLLPALILALGFGGLPPTGGSLAKAAVKPELGEGMLPLLSAISAAGSTALMLHFVRQLAEQRPEEATSRATPGLLLPWLGLALAATLLPWLLYAEVTGQAPAVSADPATLLPVLAGAMAALVLRRQQSRLPRVPPGDILCLVERRGFLGSALSESLARIEAALRAWPAAGLALLLIVLGLGAAMLAAG